MITRHPTIPHIFESIIDGDKEASLHSKIKEETLILLTPRVP